ncbi:MAG TPA: DNA translocase FtsK [Salinivirgaceae bacterium]|nr:DNA translocase FtsK [Salinivirgaceae bacterium]
MAKRSRNKNENRAKAKRGNDKRIPILLGLFFVGLSFIILVSFISFLFSWQSDSMLMDISAGELLTDVDIKYSNWMGKLGVFLSVTLIIKWVGVPAFLLIPIIFLFGMRFFGKKIMPFRATTIRLIVVMFWLSIALSYLFVDRYYLLGGAHGHYMSKWIESMLGKAGTGLFILFLAIGIIAFLFEPIFEKIVNYFRNIATNSKKHSDTETEQNELDTRIETIGTGSSEIKINVVGKEDIEDDTQSAADNNTETDSYDFVVEKPQSEDRESLENDSVDISAQSPTPIDPNDAGNNLLDVELVEDDMVDNDTDSISKNIGNYSGEVGFEIEQGVEDDEESEENLKTVAEGKYDPKLELSNYQYPTLALLPKVDKADNNVSDNELQENKNKIVTTLANYDIKIVLIKVTVGPTVTLYEIVPAPGVRISRIKNLENDIALSLAALGIRIIAPIPGKGTVGIEVPNQNPDVVTMRSVLASKKFQETEFELPLALGKTITNEAFIIDLVKAPHLLVAGATGQGKSVGLNAILTSLLYKKHPAELKLVLIDPKKVELTLYNKLDKHFLASLPDNDEPIITDTTKVIYTLNSLCVEMDSRYDLLKMAHVRNIKEYNEKFINRRLNPNKGHKYMPYIVVIIDEYADLIMTAGKEIEMPLARIAQLARAIGIHMVIATQRPTTNIITGLIKANFPARIAFRVAQGIDSKTILDGPGANQLIGRGDMLVSLGGELVRVQCAFVDTPEVDAVTDYISKQQAYSNIYELPEYVPENSGLDPLSVDLQQKDPLFEDAARLLVIHQQGSTSLIQRKFSIGYNRAGRIIDQLEAAGIVGPFEGSKARQVLIPDEYSLEQLLNNLN